MRILVLSFFGSVCFFLLLAELFIGGILTELLNLSKLLPALLTVLLFLWGVCRLLIDLWQIFTGRAPSRPRPRARGRTYPGYSEYRWEENEFGTEYGEEWEEDYVFEEPILNEEHRKQLKQLFRRTAQSCHPDKCPDHLKDTAHQLFTQLNAAFQANDIEGVQNISDIVRSGAFANPSR